MYIFSFLFDLISICSVCHVLLKFRRYDGVSVEAVEENRYFAFYKVHSHAVLHLRPAAFGPPLLSHSFVLAMEQERKDERLRKMCTPTDEERRAQQAQYDQERADERPASTYDMTRLRKRAKDQDTASLSHTSRERYERR